MNRFYRTDPPEPLSLRPREAAAALGISTRTLGRLTRAGEIQALKIGTTAAKKRRGGTITIYEVGELKAYLHRRRVVAKEVEV